MLLTRTWLSMPRWQPCEGQDRSQRFNVYP